MLEARKICSSPPAQNGSYVNGATVATNAEERISPYMRSQDHHCNDLIYFHPVRLQGSGNTPAEQMSKLRFIDVIATAEGDEKLLCSALRSNILAAKTICMMRGTTIAWSTQQQSKSVEKGLIPPSPGSEYPYTTTRPY